MAVSILNKKFFINSDLKISESELSEWKKNSLRNFKIVTNNYKISVNFIMYLYCIGTHNEF